MANRATGALKKFFHDKGYGFIQTPQGKDVFFHVNDSEDLNQDLLNEEVRLSYEISQDSRSGKNKAVNIQIEE